MDQDETRDAGPPPAGPPAGAAAGAGPSAVPEQSGEHRHKHLAGALRVDAPEEPDAAREAPPTEDRPAAEALDPVDAVEPVEPVDPVEGVDPVEPDETAGPAEVTDAVEATAPVDASDPDELDERADRPEQVDAAAPTEALERVEPADEPVELAEPAEPAGPVDAVEPVEAPEPVPAADPVGAADPAGTAGDVPPLLPGDPHPATRPEPEVARRRLGQAWRARASRAQVLAGVLCALLGFALVVQARQTQTQGLDSLRQADLVRLLDNVTNAEARAEQDVRDQQAIRDRLASGTDSSAAAQEAARQRLDTLGILAGTLPASGPGIELEIDDPRRQVDSSILLDTLEELRDGGAEVVQIGDVRVVAATAFTDDSDGVRVDSRLLTPPYRFKVIGDPQTLARLLQIPGGVLDVLKSKNAEGKVTQPGLVTVDALRPAAKPQYARPAQGGAS